MLTRRQRKGLKLMYRQGCTCNIRYNPWKKIKKEKDTCLWRNQCEEEQVRFFKVPCITLIFISKGTLIKMPFMLFLQFHSIIQGVIYMRKVDCIHTVDDYDMNQTGGQRE